jgi:hypothetical protein
MPITMCRLSTSGIRLQEAPFSNDELPSPQVTRYVVLTSLPLSNKHFWPRVRYNFAC